MQLSEIGNKIKIRRNALGITQKDLAKIMNVSNQLISKWETGESVPSLEYLDALCKALDVDYSYFIAPDGENKSNGEVKSDEKKKRRKIKWNWKLFALILTLTWVAAFVAGFIVLTIFVFVPSANRTKYINDIEKSGQKYFDLGYYSINAKTELDGDAYSDYRYDGYLDENGKLIVSTDYFDGYNAVYDENDLTKPLYYMEKPEGYNAYSNDGLEVVQIGSNTIIAVRINSVDLYGYDLYYF